MYSRSTPLFCYPFEREIKAKLPFLSFFLFKLKMSLGKTCFWFLTNFDHVFPIMRTHKQIFQPLLLTLWQKSAWGETRSGIQATSVHTISSSTPTGTLFLLSAGNRKSRANSYHSSCSNSEMIRVLSPPSNQEELGLIEIDFKNFSSTFLLVDAKALGYVRKIDPALHHPHKMLILTL